MKKITGIFIFLLIFACIGFVNAEDIVLVDNSTFNDTNLILSDTILEDTSHNHTTVSRILSDSPIKVSVVTASGGTFTQLQSIINSANSGDTVTFTGDYIYDSGFSTSGITINKNLNIVGNGHTINGLNKAKIFSITSGTVNIDDLVFVYANGTSGGAITVSGASTSLIVNHTNFSHNFANTWGGGIFSKSFDNIIVDNCHFYNNTDIRGSWSVGAGIMIYNYGSATGNLFNVFNSTFIENYVRYPTTSGQTGAAIYFSGVKNTNIFNSVFTDNWCNDTSTRSQGGAIYGTGGTIKINNNIFKDNHAVYGSDLWISSSADLNNNWWGTNNPNWSRIIYGISAPETWVIMNFSTQDTINTLSAGSIILKTTLNTVYNSTSGTFSNLIGGLYNRTVFYSVSAGYTNISSVDFSNSTTVRYNYPSGLSNVEINATIDNQTFTLGFGNLNISIINVTSTTPTIGGRLIVEINITNLGPNIASDFGMDAVVVNFTVPYPLYFISSSSVYYNNNSGLWYVGNLSSGQTKKLTISLRVPFNESFVGWNVPINVSIARGNLLKTIPNAMYDNLSISIQNKSKGSYTDLQELIDATPSGGLLNIPWDVEYDPIEDLWLKEGMRLNRSIVINGGGHYISGLDQARIFWIMGLNVEINDLNMTNGWWGTIRQYNGGGALYINGSQVNVTLNHCNFTDNFVAGWGGAIYSQIFNSLIINNCFFANNTDTYGYSSAGGAILLHNGGSFVGNLFVIENSTFIDNNIQAPTSGAQLGAAIYAYNIAVINITGSTFINNTCKDTITSTGGALYIYSQKTYVNYNIFLDNYALAYPEIYDGSGSSDINYNWWGNNNPNLSKLNNIIPETWVVMNFTNITPITYSAGSSTLLVSLDSFYNSTDGGFYKLSSSIPTRTVTFNWTIGSVSPINSNIQNNTTSIFTYPSNMAKWGVNATIDYQTLWIGSTDLGIYINSSKNPVNDGDNLTINITVVNNGLMDAYDVNITIIFPYGFLINNYTNNSGVYNNTTGIWHFGVIRPGENFTIIFNGTLADPGEYLLINATIENNTSIYEENFTNNTCLLNITVIQWSDLEITKNISNLHPKARENITYLITVTNYGPSTACNVTVYDNLSSKLIFQNFNSTKGIYNETTGIWFINSIAPNSTEILNITVFINESGITENFVNVSCPNNDTNWTNNYANVTFETASLSDLWVTINMEPQTSNFITFHIQAGNNGIENANGTIVELNISSLMMYVNHTTDGGVYGCSTGVWDIGYLRVNETVNLTLIVQLNFPAGLNVTNITNSVNITSWSTDLYPENNTDNITFEAEIFGNFRLLQHLVDSQPANTVFVLPRSFAYDPINDAFKDTDTYDLINGVSIYKNLTIVNPDGYTIGGFGMARCLNITAPNTKLDGLKIADGYSPLGAGLNIPANNVQVLRSNFTNNVLWGDYGGAIYVSGTNVLIQDNYFSHNDASKLGGAIGVKGANNLRILNNTFINNTAKSDDISGGAIGLINTQATVNTNVFVDNIATNSYHIGSAIYANNSNVNLEANWYGNNTPNMTNDELVYGNKPETWIILDWEIVNPNMTGVELNVVFVLYNSTSGEKTPLGYGLPYRNLRVTSRDPTLSWYNITYVGNNSVNYTYNVVIPTYQINATVDYETITLEFNTLLNVYKTLVNDTIWFGDDLIYNITIVNYGPHDTSIINLTDFLPSDLIINSITPSVGTVTNDSGNVYWLVSVPAGVNATLIINITPTVEGNYTNNITLNTSTSLDYFINGTNRSVFGKVLSLSDLEVNLTISSPPYYVGNNIIYNLRVANYGPSVAENIVVNMPVSSGLTYLYQDWPGTYSQSTGLWNIASLNPGDILDINITFRINSPGWYNQTVNITSDSADNNISNNNKTVSFNVTNQVDLVLNMTINKNETLYGDNGVYITLRIVNKGPSPADNVTVFTYFTGLGYLSASGYGSFVNDTPTAGRWLIGTLGVNITRTIILRFVANTVGNFTISSRVNNTYNDSNWADNYANVTINVIKYADLSINKWASNTTPYVGQIINYTISVTNNGVFDTWNVTVFDVLDSRLIYDGNNPSFNGTEWFVGNLSVGETKTLTFNVTVNGSGRIWNNVTVNSSLNDSNFGNNHYETYIDAIYKYADLIITKSVSNSMVYVGQNITYTITVTNYAGFDTWNVNVFDVLDSRLLYDGGNPSFNGTEWFVGNLSVGETKTLTFNVTVNGTGYIWNNVTVNSSLNDSNLNNNHAEVRIFGENKYADLSIIKTASSSAVYVGQNITYTITVTNTKGYNTENVTVIDILDSNLIYDGNNPDYDGMTWFVGNLSVGETKTLSFNVTVNANGTIWNNATVNSSLPDSNLGNNRANVSIYSGSLVADLSITKTVSKSKPFLDENITYTITVTNLAGFTAENVTVYDVLPSVLVYDGNNPNYNGTEWFVGNLSVGETKTLTFIVTVNGIGRIWNNVTVNSSLPDPNPNNNKANVPIDVPVDGDLRISLNVVPNPPQANTPFIINVTVKNCDNESNNNVMVDFLLPPSLSYINSTGMGSYNPITGRWNIGYLAANTSVNLEIWVYPGVIDNVTITGNVSGQVVDINPNNNRANLTFEIVPAFDLTITKTPSTYLVTDGDTISFNITVWNNGPYIARNVKITDYLPGGVEYLFDNSSGVYYNTNRTVIWSLPYLNVGDNITINLILKVQGPGLNFNNKVIVSAYGTDINITDNTAYSGVINVTQVNDLEVTITSSKTEDIGIGEIITFYVTVTNHGPSNASGVIANFFLPNDLIYVNDNSGGYYLPGSGIWYIGSLANGSSVTLQVRANLTKKGNYNLNATVNGSYYDNDTSNNFDTLNISSTSVFDLNITAYWNLTDNTVLWNDLVNYTVIVHNSGPDNATNVTVTLVVPGVSYVNYTGVGILNTTTMIWNVGNLTAGESKNITITFNATSLGFFINTGNIKAHGYDTNLSNNNYTLNLTIVPVVDLVMTNISVNSTLLCVDGLLEFNVTVFNRGPCNATNTTILGLLPAGWNIVGGMTFGNVPVNKSEVFTIIVNATSCGNFTIGFNATTNAYDTNITNNWMFIDNITIVYASDIMITIKTNTLSLLTGDIVVYVITVSNLDWHTAHNITANVTIPNGLSFHHYYKASGNYNPSNGTWTIGDLSYRNSTSLFLYCTVDTVGDIEFWVNVSGDDYDFHTWNNNDTVNITGTLGLDLNITIFVDNSTPYTGDNITFTVIVENIGLANAEGVSVDISIPDGFVNPRSSDLNFTGSSYYIGKLSAGGIKEFNFTVTPILLVNGTFNVSVGANRVDYNLSNNFANLTVYPIAATDLIVTITSNNSNPRIDENVIYTITVYNNGTVDADNVMVYNNLPYSTVYAISTLLYNPITKLWIITNLSAGASETLNITINHTTIGIFNYTVNITGDIIDTKTINNLDNITTIVSNYNDLITYFTVTNNTILVDDLLNLTITVHNNGTFNNTNVIVYTDLPHTTYYNGSQIFDTNLGIWYVGDLKGFENKTLNLLVNISTIGNYTFWANSTGKIYDRNLTNNNQSINITTYTDYNLKVNITVNKTSINLGESLKFTIEILNNGPSTAYNINITDNIYGTILNITKGTYTINKWNIPSLKAGETGTLTLTLIPTSNGTFNYNVSTDNTSDNVTVNVSNAVDLIITIATNTSIANKTDHIEYLVTVYNNGLNTANNVLVESDNLFDNALIINPSTGLILTNSWFIPTIAGYGNVTLNITKTLNTTTITIVNVTSSDIELNKSNNQDNVTVNINKVSDLLVTIDVNNTNPYIGEEVTFTVTVYNLGEDVADNVTVYLDLPYNTNYTNTYMYDTLQGVWLVGTLENNTNKTLNLTLSLNFTGTITYNATVNSPNIDSNITNNYDNVTLNITSLMDLNINITINTTNTIYVDDTISFIITVRNNGPESANSVIANLNIPGNILSISQGMYTSGIWNIGTLLKDQTVQLILTRNLTLTDAKEYQVNVTSPDTDKNISNNNASLKLNITPVSDLEIIITANNTILNIAEPILYNITIINHGPNNLTSSTVNITIPKLFNITGNISTNGIFNGTDWILSNLNSLNNATLLIYGYYTDGGNQTIKGFTNSTNHDKNITNNYDKFTVYVNKLCDLILNFTSNMYYNPDGTLSFNITVTNNGPSLAENIKIHTNLDNTNDYNATLGYFDTLQNIWYIDSLNPGQVETLIINTTILTDYLYFANATTTTPDSNNTNNIKFLNLTLTPLADLSINITINNSNPHIGESVTFTVTVINNGPCNASDVRVYTTLPASTDYTISKGLYDTVYGNWSVGNLSIGEIQTLNITINITSLGDYIYTVNITGTVNDTNNTNNNDSINFTVLNTADLSIKILINTTNTTVGDNITFTISIYNNGPSLAENTTINIELPNGFIQDPITPTIGTYSNGEWNITNINNGTNITLNITGIITLNGTTTIKANITSNTFDNDTNNNQDTITINVENLVDLEVKILANTTTIYSGEFIELIINITNHGPGTAHNILVNTNITGATSTKNKGYYDTNTGYWFIENLNTNNTEILKLTLRITENTTFQTNATTTNKDTNISNNKDTINITVQPLADLNITVKTSSLNQYYNEEIIYEITVTNNGYTTAENITVTTNLPTTGFNFIYSNTTNYNNTNGLWTIGNLSHNQKATLTLKYKTTNTGLINHTFTVKTTTFESHLNDNTVNLTIYVNNTLKPTEGMVDLIINITVNNSLPPINSTITFNITIFNNGSTTANNITIKNILPPTITPIGTYTGTWNLNNLTGYTEYSITFTANVTNYGSFVTNASVDCTEWDTNPVNNRANQLIIIKESGTDYLDLSINITREGNLTLGELLTYNITVTNHGPQDATDINATIGLFENLKLISSNSTDYNETLNQWNIGNLTSGSSKTLSLTVNITETGQYTNIFIVWNNQTDKNP